MFLAASVVATLTAAPLPAQDTLPPELGGYVHSLGLPAVYKPYVTLGVGAGLRGEHELEAQGGLGVYRDLGNPVTELGGVSLEAYARTIDSHVDGGLRGLVLSHFFRLGGGIDLPAATLKPAFVLTFVAPVRRGGIVGNGSDLRLQWTPARGQLLSLNLTIPFRQPNLGRTRPRRSRVELREDIPRPLPFHAADSVLESELAEMRRAAAWVNRYSVPDIGRALNEPAADIARRLGPLVSHAEQLGGGAVHTSGAEVEIRAYHRAMAVAFSRALDPGTAASGEPTA
ncbi:MAG TPA: hypothetical protein VG692_04125, partial [Gemmatimonadales bacterium]|nr:hypothetical protein [Gemmatimonadales bacterium]